MLVLNNRLILEAFVESILWKNTVSKDESMNRNVREVSSSGYMGIIKQEITEETESKPGL